MTVWAIGWGTGRTGRGTPSGLSSNLGEGGYQFFYIL